MVHVIKYILHLIAYMYIFLNFGRKILGDHEFPVHHDGQEVKTVANWSGIQFPRIKLAKRCCQCIAQNLKAGFTICCIFLAKIYQNIKTNY